MMGEHYTGDIQDKISQNSLISDKKCGSKHTSVTEGKLFTK